MSRKRQVIRILVAVILLGVCARPLSADVVVSQIYGGGGNAGALLKLDFIELFNRGTSAVSVSGWSVQYASAAAATWQATPLIGTLQPGTYYLVQLGGGSGGTVDLPPADASGTTNMSAAAGKVALVSSSVALSVDCPNDASIRDFVGYGTANCFEGTAPAAAGTNTTALLRTDGGCRDLGENASDFGTATPNPRNQSSSVHPCSSPLPSETPTASPSVTSTLSMTPTHSLTPSPSSSPTSGPEDSATPTPTRTPSPSETMSQPTSTKSPTASATPPDTETPTPTESSTPSATSTRTPTSTSNDTDTPSATATESETLTPTPSSTPSLTASDTWTPTATETCTPTPSQSPTPSVSISETATASATPTSPPTTSACGNGVAEPGEQCDDGNDADGDLCPASCSYRLSGALVHGNHRLRTVRGDGCQLEWYVVDNDLIRDRYGVVGATQTCVDQDPGCDTDGAVGQCRLTVVACLNNTDPNLPNCLPGGISRAEVVYPPRARAGLRAVNRAAIEQALAHLVDPNDPQPGGTNTLPLLASDTDFCSQPFTVGIELHGARVGVTNLIVDTFSATGRAPRRERSRLRLICTS